MAMDIAALTLLFDNTTVKALAIAWPKVGMQRGDGPITAELERRWAAVAGISPHEIAVWEEMLFTNEILTRDGQIDPTALAFLRRDALGRLPKEIRQQLAQRQPEGKANEQGGR